MKRLPGTAYDQLHDLLVRGILTSGSRVTEAQLAKRLGISRTPVREAMRRLQHEHLLVQDGGGKRPRVAVAPLSAHEAMHVYEATGALEGLASRAIATMHPADRKALAEELAKLDEEFRAASVRRTVDADVLFERHTAFHQCLRNVCNAPVFATLLDTLGPRLARYQWHHAPLLQEAQMGFSSMHREHAAIIKAVRSGDATALEQAVRANWQHAARRLADAIAASTAKAVGATSSSRHRRSVKRERD